MKILDMLIQEINNNLTEEQKREGGKWERLHSDPVQIVQTEHGKFYNPTNVKTKKEE